MNKSEVKIMFINGTHIRQIVYGDIQSTTFDIEEMYHDGIIKIEEDEGKIWMCPIKFIQHIEVYKYEE